MKKQLIPVLCLCWCFFPQLIRAQVPQRFSYQAVIRNPAGQVLANQAVSIRLSILQGNETGAAVYIETHAVTTNLSGLVTLQVGGGTNVNGSISGIVWANGPYFIKTETDPFGGNNYSISGTSQLLSVPFALYSSGGPPGPAGPPGAAGTGGFVHYPGEKFGGGVVFHVFRDSDGIEHGLVVSTVNISEGQSWSNITGLNSGAGNSWNGLPNSNAVLAQAGHTNSAAKLCLDYGAGGYSDWYLPSKFELTKLWENILDVNRSLSTMSGATEIFSNSYGSYWSSTENNSSNAWSLGYSNFLNVVVFGPFFNAKSSSFMVRAIRAYSVPSGLVSDADGNAYQTVSIGSQTWMKENLKVTRYRNGDPVLSGLSEAEWEISTNGAFSSYNNDSSNNSVFGRLYNWYAVSDTRGLCPAGWHVPSDAEWYTLESFLDPAITNPLATGLRGSVAGGKMKTTGTIEASTGRWGQPNTGANNQSGFSGLPGGYRQGSGEFGDIGIFGGWWSSTENTGSTAWYRGLLYNSQLIGRFSTANPKTAGFSVRCLKD